MNKKKRALYKGFFGKPHLVTMLKAQDSGVGRRKHLLATKTHYTTYLHNYKAH